MRLQVVSTRARGEAGSRRTVACDAEFDDGEQELQPTQTEDEHFEEGHDWCACIGFWSCNSVGS